MNFTKLITTKNPLKSRRIPFYFLNVPRCVSNEASPPSRPLNSQVVIVGGGPTGLLLSILLSQYNVTHTLIEGRSAAQIHSHPQAHYLNLRTMEILKHNIPNAYDNVIKSMPHVEEWEGFTFGYSVLGRQIARVVHPVSRGIQVGQDGNGTLVEEGMINKFKKGYTVTDVDVDNSRCSICNPCHLAQNKFSSILLDEARRMLEITAQSDDGLDTNCGDSLSASSHILHSEPVTSIRETKESQYPISIKTDKREINASYVIAADGSKSQIRNIFGGDRIMAGDAEMQHLINVHFKTSSSATKKLMERKETVGMLHFVFHSRVVGAFVCHNLEEGEWVLQIPYFPPFQDPSDFTIRKVQEMVASGLGLNGDAHAHVKILSVKPWTMSATVAKSFFLGSSKRIVLAGDAAHTFPPAGGFGMNTGLQDAHNLAWRLACALQLDESLPNDDDDDDNCRVRSDPDILEPYESERRPIAAQNASLSVRNYNRTLDIAKACYLNADHPSLLKKVMESPPMSFIPISVRKQTFNVAVSVAMTPLTNLTKKGNLYGESIVSNVRKILRLGGGLPLLFPRYEIDFSYEQTQALDHKDDTAGFHPELAIGKRLPHCLLKRIIHEGNGQIVEEAMTMTDIESQIQKRWERALAPTFYIIVMSPHPSNDIIQSMVLEWSNRNCLSIFELYSNRSIAMDRYRNLPTENGDGGMTTEIFIDENNFLINLVQSYCQKHGLSVDSSLEENTHYAMLIRPDGHIADIATFKDEVVAL